MCLKPQSDFLVYILTKYQSEIDLLPNSCNSSKMAWEGQL